MNCIKRLLSIALLLSLLTSCGAPAEPASSSGAMSVVNQESQETTSQGGAKDEVSETQEFSIEECQANTALLKRVLASINPADITIKAVVYAECNRTLGGPPATDVVPVAYEKVNGAQAAQADNYLEAICGADYNFYQYGMTVEEFIEDRIYLFADEWHMYFTSFGNVGLYYQGEFYCYKTEAYQFRNWIYGYDVLLDWYQEASGTDIVSWQAQ